MKKTFFLSLTLLMSLMFAFVSCDDDDDLPREVNNYKAKMAAVTKEIQQKKQHDKALLLVSFGSTWDAPQATFKSMKEQFEKKFPDMDVYFSFTSEICMTRCAAKGWYYYAPSFYLNAIGQAGYKTVCVQSLHVIPGEEYLRVQNVVKDFHNNGDNPEFENITVYLGGPLLHHEADVNRVAEELNKKYASTVNSGKIVAFMGHGNPEGMNYGNGNSRYVMLEKALQKYSPNYYVATVDMEDNFVLDMIGRMKANGVKEGTEVICHPLMSIAGDHANNDMKGGVDPTSPEEESWRYELNKAGFVCPLGNCHIKGLGDYPEIVNIWMSHMTQALAEGPVYQPE